MNVGHQNCRDREDWFSRTHAIPEQRNLKYDFRKRKLCIASPVLLNELQFHTKCVLLVLSNMSSK
jgi:hypothetical protein